MARRRRRRWRKLPSDPATDYAVAVLDGQIVTGELVRLACERHLNDIETAEERGLFWDPERAQRALYVIGEMRQSKGRWAGQKLELMPWQQFVTGQAFGWMRLNEELDVWVRRFKHILIDVAKKQGKTTWAAAIGHYHFDFDDEPGAEIYVAATKRDQARLCWDEAASMARKTPALKTAKGGRIKIIDSTAHMTIVATDSKFVALGADRDTTDGVNPSCTIIDELHRHKNRGLVDILTQSSATRLQPQTWYITTAGLTGDSIYLEIHDYGARVVRGAVVDDEWLVYIATPDEGDDWRDETTYIKGNPSLNVTVQLSELIAERDRALEKPASQNTFIRLRTNRITGQVSRAIDLVQWDLGNTAVDPEALRGRECWGGLDLASTRDVTALVLLFPDDEGSFDVLPFFWLPEEAIASRSTDTARYDLWAEQGFVEATDGIITDYDRIEAAIREIQAEYGFNIREIAFDRWNASQIVTHLMEDGLTMVPFGQGFASMSAPTKELVDRLIPGELLRHGGHPVLRFMADSLSVREDPAGNKKPDRESSADKIDGMVALIMALGRTMVGEGEERSGYLDHGVRTL